MAITIRVVLPVKHYLSVSWSAVAPFAAARATTVQYSTTTVLALTLHGHPANAGLDWSDSQRLGH